jgi:hypothetical protein
MNHFKDMPEEDTRRLLAGTAPEGDSGLGEVAGFVRSLKAAYPDKPVSCSVEEAHVAELVAAARLLSESGEPAASRRRLRPVGLALKLAAATVVFVMLFCGLAWAGTLPGPIQTLASRAALAIGVHIERPRAKPVVPAGGPASPSAKPSPTAKRGAVVKPSPRAKPVKAAAAHPSKKRDGTGGQGPAGGHEQNQPEDQIVGQDEPQPQDEDQIAEQPQDPDHDDGQDEPPPEDDTQPPDEPQPQDVSGADD